MSRPRCRKWLSVLSTLLCISGPALSQTDHAALEVENQLLRQRVAQLEAQLAALDEAGSCTDVSTGTFGTGTPLALLRKLAGSQLETGRILSGHSSAARVIPKPILGAFVPGEYIVLTDGEVPQSPPAAANGFGLIPSQILHIYKRSFQGFAVRMTPEQAARIAAQSGVRAVVRNGYVFAAGQQGTPEPAPPRSATPKPANTIADDDAVDVFLLDTGVRSGHSDLFGRVSTRSFSYFDNGIGAEDCSGHGTHVAARIAGEFLGVTDRARIISVKVMDQFGTGDVATVVAGLEWVLDQPGERKLVNMSLTRRVTEDPSVLDIAVQAAIDEGVTVVVAAGNAASDVSEFSPARVEDAITVGSALDLDLSSFSNAGTGVDLYTSGEDIVSASIRDVCAVRKMSGTSMAAPMVTGLIADLMAQGLSGENALSVLQRQARRVKTGSRSRQAERIRLVLDHPEPETRVCAFPPKIIYDDGLALPDDK